MAEKSQRRYIGAKQVNKNEVGKTKQNQKQVEDRTKKIRQNITDMNKIETKYSRWNQEAKILHGEQNRAKSSQKQNHQSRKNTPYRNKIEPKAGQKTRGKIHQIEVKIEPKTDPKIHQLEARQSQTAKNGGKIQQRAADGAGRAAPGRLTAVRGRYRSPAGLRRRGIRGRRLPKGGEIEGKR